MIIGRGAASRGGRRRHPRRLRGRLVLLLVAAVLGASACSADEEPGAIPLLPDVSGSALVTPDPVPVARPAAGGAGVGSVLSVGMAGKQEIRPITELGAVVKRVEYRSTSGVTGQPTVVSGIVAVPGGTPPAGGWVTVAFGHGNTGVRHKCGPSAYTNLLGSDVIVAALLYNGFAVAMPDYQGLGMTNLDNPFLDARTYGYNMIDAVRAARATYASLSDRWISYGVSLGGMSAWAAGELGPTYGRGLDLLGTAALVPVSNMRDLATKAAAGTLTRDQYPLLAYLIDALSRVAPDQFNPDDYRSSYAKSVWEDVLNCIPTDNLDAQLRTIQSLGPADLRPKDAAAQQRLYDWLDRTGLPLATGGAHGTPTLIMYGTDDKLIDWPWTARVVKQSCDQGANIQAIKRVGETHSTLNSAQSVAWMLNLANGGRAAMSNCGVLP
ncbi:lipase family protein [Gordonia sp. NPDC003504]